MAERVLIVEDNESLRAGIKVSLEESGFSVQDAASGEEAVQKLEAESFHVVVSDIRLGDLTGVDILKKAKEVNSGTEVILMTAYATVETAIQALRLGAFDYIQKPFEIEQLQRPICVNDGAAKSNCGVDRQTIEHTSAGVPGACYEREHLIACRHPCAESQSRALLQP